jgi:SAM-dependent methyltransferase
MAPSPVSRETSAPPCGDEVVITERKYAGLRENASPNTHNVVAELISGIPGVKKILDIPCGEGAFTRRMQDRGFEVHSGDRDNFFRVPGGDCIICDMDSSLLYPDGSFDAVACIDGIAHIKRPFDFIAECRRILRPQGCLVISIPNISALRSRGRWFLTGFHNKRKVPPDEERVFKRPIINMMSFDMLRYLLHTGGFSISEIRTNRIKPINWLYAGMVPFSYLATRWAFHRHEKNHNQRVRNRDILRQLFSREVLFGESIIVKAVCCPLPRNVSPLTS